MIVDCLHPGCCHGVNVLLLVRSTSSTRERDTFPSQSPAIASRPSASSNPRPTSYVPRREKNPKKSASWRTRPTLQPPHAAMEWLSTKIHASALLWRGTTSAEQRGGGARLQGAWQLFHRAGTRVVSQALRWRQGQYEVCGFDAPRRVG